MRVVFRADAGLAIGTGHVMRCLTLADELARQGHDCAFVARDLPGNLNARIAARYRLTELPAPAGPPPAPPPDHAAWAGVDWAQDAAETRVALGGADWLVVDHYAFDARWQGAARPAGARLMVIDDLADRPHDCDLLLDQNLGRHGADYDPLLPDGCERLIGPRFALLRPEFAAARPAALAERAARGPGLRRLLVALGGIDADNVTEGVLRALADWPGAPALRVEVILGPTAPHPDRLRALALPFDCRVLAGVDDMAARFAAADLAIGAAGTSAWERCALGLPVLLVTLAENQRAGTAALVAAGAALDLGDPGPDLARRLHGALDRLLAPPGLSRLAGATAAITDGRGAARVADALETPLALRPASPADAETVWHWRAALPPDQFRAGATPPLAQHLDWFARALTDPGRILLMAGGRAHLRLDLNGDTATVSILIAPQARGQGLGLRLLAALEPLARRHGLTRLEAEVALANPASAALFRAAGYAEQAPSQGFIRFDRALRRPPPS